MATCILAVGVLGLTPSSHALVSFGRVAVLNGNALSDDVDADDFTPSLATDGNGNWVAVWSSLDSLGGTIGSGVDLFVATSSDNGATWTGPAVLNPDAATDSGSNSRIATDGAGVWIVSWLRGPSPDVVVTRSLDNGSTWATPVSLGFSGLPGVIASDGGNNWVVISSSQDDLGGTIGNDRDLLVVRSTDDGVTWGAPSPLNTDAASDGARDDGVPALAADGAGTLVVVWTTGGLILAATSTDNGVTWADPVIVSLAVDFAVTPDIATDGAGNWIAVWDSGDSLGGTIGTDFDILFSASQDDGATWTAAAPVDTTAATSGGILPSVATDGLGNWYVAWVTTDPLAGTIGKDFDILIARTSDVGATWTASAALHANASRDKEPDILPKLFYDGAGNWIAVWYSDDSLGNTIGNDHDILFALSSDDCPLAPAGGCLGPVSVGDSRVRLKDGKGGRDKLRWKWRGQETLPGDLGDPTTTTDYALCLYDSVSGVPQLVLEKDMPGGQTCKDKPCWKSASGGFRYKDPRLEHGAIKALALASGVDGKAKVKLQARSPTLGPPSLPLAQSPSVRAQLLNLENGRCWEATYATAAKNDSKEFKASSD